MKLYLSSYRLGDNTQQLVELSGENKRVAVIANAMDFLNDPESRSTAADREIADLKALGLQPEEVDLRMYFGKPESLTDTMSNFGMVWVRGGNVFVLRMAYKQSRFDEWLQSQRANKELVYGGYSAGVCVLSPSLKGLEIVDNPTLRPEGYNQNVVWEGLGLIDFAFAPHYMSNHPESEAVGRLVDYDKSNGIKYKALRDGEVLIQEIS